MWSHWCMDKGVSEIFRKGCHRCARLRVEASKSVQQKTRGGQMWKRQSLVPQWSGVPPWAPLCPHMGLTGLGGATKALLGAPHSSCHVFSLQGSTSPPDTLCPILHEGSGRMAHGVRWLLPPPVHLHSLGMNVPVPQ